MLRQNGWRAHLHLCFAVESGLRQGCPLAPTLFNIALEWVMRRTPAAGGVRMGGQHFDRLAYADDVDIMGRDTGGRYMRRQSLLPLLLGGLVFTSTVVRPK